MLIDKAIYKGSRTDDPIDHRYVHRIKRRHLPETHRDESRERVAKTWQAITSTSQTCQGYNFNAMDFMGRGGAT